MPFGKDMVCGGWAQSEKRDPERQSVMQDNEEAIRATKLGSSPSTLRKSHSLNISGPQCLHVQSGTVLKSIPRVLGEFCEIVHVKPLA